MALPLDLPALETAAASDIKTKGWPSLMRKVRAHGAVVVTNHQHREAVVVDAQAYAALVAQARAAAGAEDRARSLARLQAEFDGRLAAMQDGRLGTALARPARRGPVKLGEPR